MTRTFHYRKTWGLSMLPFYPYMPALYASPKSDLANRLHSQIGAEVVADPEELRRSLGASCAENTRSSLYIHIPFCERICSFCTYTKYPLGRYRSALDRYVDAVCKEIAMYGETPYVRSRLRFESIYFGGGTPTVLLPEQLGRILSACRAHLDIAPTADVTSEGNAAHFARMDLRSLRANGINRISMGVQSFTRETIEAALLPGDPEATGITAIARAREAGLENVGIDLMYGFPGQTMAAWQNDIDTAIGLKVDHLSIYGVQLEPEVPLAKMVRAGKRSAMPHLETSVSMFESAIDRLTTAGYNHDAAHDFGLPGKPCKQMQLTFDALDNPGIGCGAAGYVNGHAYCNFRTVEEYLAAVEADRLPTDIIVKASPRNRMERTMIGWSCRLSYDRREFRARHGAELDDVYGREIQLLVGAGLALDRGQVIELTREGQVFYNNVAAEFFPHESMRKLFNLSSAAIA